MRRIFLLIDNCNRILNKLQSRTNAIESAIDPPPKNGLKERHCSGLKNEKGVLLF